MKLELIAATAFGLEAVARREIEALGYKILKTEDGKVCFSGDERALVRSNLWLRSAERVQIKMAEFEALEFEELFQCIKGVAWEEWIPPDGHVVMNASSVKSKLSSVPAIQSVSEKALLSRLGEVYGVERFSKSGALYELKLTLLKDRATLTLDTSGDSLHKRGYRRLIGGAPLKETLAAALVELSFWKPDRILLDPCCGSGTFAIEAALIGLNIAPGISRHFSAESWEAIPKALWKEERASCYRQIKDGCALKIHASDIDGAAIEIAKKNAEAAGVDEFISFDVSDVSKMRAAEPYGVVIANPPYGERIGDRESIAHIYDSWRLFFRENPTWSLFCLTSDKSIENKVFSRPADRRRKLYNGRLEVCYYQFHGERRPRS